MFKLESYVTPLLLSYVDKYIKNFKPEDSQVSLWGGDAVFSNLDLRLEVLEQELQLPFTFVSGHIHELRIHVPWTKLASEPIVVTINTIECTLKLHEDSDSDSSSRNSYSSSRKEAKKKASSYEMDAPPGYVQSLISKIISNVSIVCNNLILKYVEEDIVLSVNVKMFSMVSVDKNWQPAFIELSAVDLCLRKVASLSDLTVCLDKRGASGKIESYQEPLLYRCSLELHLAQQYHSLLAKRPCLTRLDVCCACMEFSLTPLQVPMVMRLIRLALALYARELRDGGREGERAGEAGSEEQGGDAAWDGGEGEEGEDEDGGTWTGWAMSWVPSILPLYWEEENSEEAMDGGLGGRRRPPRSSVVHLGVFVQQAGLTLKATDTSSGGGPGGGATGVVATVGGGGGGGGGAVVGGAKIRFSPFACMHLQAVRMEVILRGQDAVLVQLGVGQLTIDRVGDCLCGVREHKSWAKAFLSAGRLLTSDFRKGSLFDLLSQTEETAGPNYDFTWESHLRDVTEASLLEQAPAFALDYLYVLELSDEYDSDLESDLEYSNLPEKALCRLVVGPSQLCLDSAFLHACQMVLHSAQGYDYVPYGNPRADENMGKLEVPSEEEIQFLETNFPVRVYQITIFKPVLLLTAADHPQFDPSSYQTEKRKKKGPLQPTLPAPLPSLSLECECLDAKLTRPMYPSRLVRAVAAMTNPPAVLFQRCHSHLDAKVFGLEKRLRCGEKQASVVLPCNLTFGAKELLLQSIWKRKDVCLKEFSLEIGRLTVMGSKPHVLTVCQILQSLLPPHRSKLLKRSSLVKDLISDQGTFLRLQLLLYSLDCRMTTTSSASGYQLSIGEVEVSSVVQGHTPTSDHHVTLLAGPSDTAAEAVLDGPLIQLVLQVPKKEEEESVPVVYLATRGVSCYLAAGFYKWMIYRPKLTPLTRETVEHTTSASETQQGPSSAGSDSQQSHHHHHLHHHPHQQQQRQQQAAPKARGHKHQHHPRESVHSSEKARDAASVPAVLESSQGRPSGGQSLRTEEQGSTSGKGGWRETLTRWLPLLTSPLVCIHIDRWTLYLPADGDVRNMSESLDTIVVTLPQIDIRNTNLPQNIATHLTKLPLILPVELWPPGRQGFPLKLSLVDFSCASQHSGEEKDYMLHPITTNCTLALAHKKQEHQSPNSLGLCLHADMGTLHLSLTIYQASVFTLVLDSLLQMSLELFPSNSDLFLNENVNLGPTSGAAAADRVTPPLLPQHTSVASVSEPTTPLVATETEDTDDALKVAGSVVEDSRGLTLWIQWTLTHLILTTYGALDKEDGCPRVKLVAEVEDIVTSIDLQHVFLKVKLKVAAANVRHFRRAGNSNWVSGCHLGVVLSCGEDITNEVQVLLAPGCNLGDSSPGSEGGASPSEDSPRSVRFPDGPSSAPAPPPPTLRTASSSSRGFLSFTFTCAQVHSVHEKWQQLMRRHFDEELTTTSTSASLSHGAELSSRHLSELDVELRPVDIVLSAEAIRPFLDVLKAWTEGMSAGKAQYDVEGVSVVNSLQWNNNTLPLLYVKTKGVRVFLPLTDKKTMAGDGPDMCLLQVECVNLTCQVDNPLGRVFVRADIYRTAEQARILGVPGAEVEDRQYQLDVTGLSISTGSWAQVEQQSRKQSPSSTLRTMGENPALDWNSLEIGKEMCNEVLLLPLLSRLHLRLMAAPAVVYLRGREAQGKHVLVCGHSLEANAVSDAVVTLSLPQLRLLSEVTSELMHLGGAFLGACGENGQGRLPQDSGVDCDSTGVGSMQLPSSQVGKPRGSTTESVPAEILFTGAKITVTLYDIGQPQRVPRKKLAKVRVKGHNYEGDSDESYYASEEESVIKLDVENGSWRQQVRPLLYAMVSQPHTFVSVLASGQRMELSFFDMAVKMAAPSHLVAVTKTKQIPKPEDFSLHFFETKQGDPHPKTGIPPALVTLTLTNFLRKPYQARLELGRPWKVHLSSSLWDQLEATLQKTISCLSTFVSTSLPARKERSVVDQQTLVRSFRNSAAHVSSLSFYGQQGVFSVKGGDGAKCELLVGFSTLKGTASCFVRPQGFQVDRVSGNLALGSLVISTSLSGRSHVLLNPWSVTFEGGLYWESWLLDPDCPLIQVTADSDPLLLDVGPDHIKTCELIADELQEMFKLSSMALDKHPSTIGSPPTSFSPPSPNTISSVPNHNHQEQHYQDDLRAGAFQYSCSSDLPLPYQLVFTPPLQCQDSAPTPTSMSWRYPQPRCLTRVDINPLPFRDSSRKDNGKRPRHSEDDEEVICALQYWDEAQAMFRTYCRFGLSESHRCRLELPVIGDKSKVAVAAMWRVCLDYREDDEDGVESSSWRVSPKALAGCMRVDSYFSPSLVPWLQVAVKFPVIRVTFRNHLHTLDSGFVGPSGMFRVEPLPVLDHPFTSLAAEKTSLRTSMWTSSAVSTSLSTHLRWDVVDYRFLTQHAVLEPFAIQGRLSLSEPGTKGRPGNVEIDVVTKPLRLKVGQAAVHTLTVSLFTWQAATQSLNTHFKSCTSLSRSPAALHAHSLPHLTHYMIQNDTHECLRVGQAGTRESLRVHSRAALPYTWRSQHGELQLWISLEGPSCLWSRPFGIDKDGVKVRVLREGDNGRRVAVEVEVMAISGTQKQVTITGQLSIVNLLSQSLCIQLLDVESTEFQANEEVGNCVKDEWVCAEPHKRPSSLLVDPSLLRSLRLSLTCQGSVEAACTWSQEVSMQTVRPEFVKVPGAGSESCNAWCSIFRQDMGEEAMRVLVVVSPLFMVRSHLPLPVRLTVSTPGLGVSREVSVPGRSRTEELGCVGTLDHTHQLTFRLSQSPILISYFDPPLVPCPSFIPESLNQTDQINPKLPESSPSVPLSCGMANQFQAMPPSGHLDIAAWLREFHSKKEHTWPFIGNEESQMLQWVEAAQPDTDVQVHFSQPYPPCPSLQVELKPWTLLVNLSGASIFLQLKDGGPSWEAPSRGVLALSRIQESFRIGVLVGGAPFWSVPVLLSEEEWPHEHVSMRADGERKVPLQGFFRLQIHCQEEVYLLTMSSLVSQGMRILCVRPAFTILNKSSHPLWVKGLMVMGCPTSQKISIPTEVSQPVPLPADTLGSRSKWALLLPGHPLHCWAVIRSGEEREQKMVEVIDDEENETEEDATYHLWIRLGEGEEEEWGCPLHLGLTVRDSGEKHLRRTVQLPRKSKERHDIKKDFQSNYPFVVTVHQKDQQVFLVVREDGGVQLVLHNHCSFSLHYAQTLLEEGSPVELPRSLSSHFEYWPVLLPHCSASYTFPWVTEIFPEIYPSGKMPRLLLAKGNAGDEGILWSTGVDVELAYDRFLGLPGHGDVKLGVNKKGEVVHVTVEQVSRIEVSAKEIRSRLQSNLPAIDQAERPTDPFSSVQPAVTSPNPSTLPASQNAIKQSVSILVFCQKAEAVLMDDLGQPGVRSEVLALTLSQLGLSVLPRTDYDGGRVKEFLDFKMVVGDVQLDNQMYFGGSFDFPVVLLREPEQREEFDSTRRLPSPLFGHGAKELLGLADDSAVLRMSLSLHGHSEGTESVEVELSPFSLYLEHQFYQALTDVLYGFVSKMEFVKGRTIVWDAVPREKEEVLVRHNVVASSVLLSKPLRLSRLEIHPLRVLLTLRASPGLYLALDHSPLHFSAFQRSGLCTTASLLGAAIGRHYVYEAVVFESAWLVGGRENLSLKNNPSGALLRTCKAVPQYLPFLHRWHLVSSLELLGSPGGLARSVGLGLRDLVQLPYEGLLQGPWGLVVGLGLGCGSLLRHLTAGTLLSVTNLASSVARNLDRLGMDSDHFQRNEEGRRRAPQGVVQGFVRGLSGLGVSLLDILGDRLTLEERRVVASLMEVLRSPTIDCRKFQERFQRDRLVDFSGLFRRAVGGLAHHPMQSVMTEGVSTQGLVRGVGRGLVGALTKPLGGAAEFVALTGKGLLSGAGWSRDLQPSREPVVESLSSFTNSRLKYEWQLCLELGEGSGGCGVLHVAEAAQSTPDDTYLPVSLVLTSQALLVLSQVESAEEKEVDEEEGKADARQQIMSLLETECSDQNSDPTLLVCIYRPQGGDSPEPTSFCEDFIMDFVRGSAVHFSPSEASGGSSSQNIEDTCQLAASASSKPVPPQVTRFYLGPHERSSFGAVFALAKRQAKGLGFQVLR